MTLIVLLIVAQVGWAASSEQTGWQLGSLSPRSGRTAGHPNSDALQRNPTVHKSTLLQEAVCTSATSPNKAQGMSWGVFCAAG